MARRSRELASAEARLAYLLAHGRDAYLERLPAFERALGEEVARLDRHFATCRPPTSRPSSPTAASTRSGTSPPSRTWTWTARRGRSSRSRRSGCCRCARGTLSELERLQIELHVVHSYPFPQPDSVDARDPPHPGDRARPSRKTERHGLSRAALGARDSDPDADDDDLGHLRRAVGRRPPLQAGDSDRARPRHPRIRRSPTASWTPICSRSSSRRAFSNAG